MPRLLPRTAQRGLALPDATILPGIDESADALCVRELDDTRIGLHACAIEERLCLGGVADDFQMREGVCQNIWGQARCPMR